MIGLGEQADPRIQTRGVLLRRWLPISLAVLDAVLIATAFVLAYWFRYSLKVGPQIHEQLAFRAYVPLAVLLLGIMMPVLFLKGAYRLRMGTETLDEAGTIFSSATITVAAIVVTSAMLHQWQYSRGVILYVWILVIALTILGRSLYRSVQTYCFQRGWGVRRLLVVGATDAGKMVMQSVTQRPDLGYQLVGFVVHRSAPPMRDFGRFRALGTVADIPGLLENGAVDEIILALPASAHEEVWPVLDLCQRRGVGFKLVPNLFELSLGKVQIDDIAGIPLLDVRERPLGRTARAGKRLLDLVAASLMLILSMPLLAILAILVRLESPGPAFLRQERVGMRGECFGCLKLRTMRDGADVLQPTLLPSNETGGITFKMRDDPRVTRAGRWMRRWSLDEVPQLWNVLVGEMSLVGPRPPLPHEVAQYEPHHRRRLDVKPGMTGIWQVSGRSDLSFDEMVMMDTYYVDNWSLVLDMKILIRTTMAVLDRHGAY